MMFTDKSTRNCVQKIMKSLDTDSLSKEQLKKLEMQMLSLEKKCYIRSLGFNTSTYHL